MKDREWRKKVQRKRFLRNSNLILYGRLAVFLLLVGLQVFILLVTDMPMFWGVLAVECVLVLENIVKMIVLKKFSHKIACYVIDFIGVLTLTLLTRTSLVSTLCMVILSEFYLSTRSFGANVAMAAVWEVFYLAIRVTTAFVWENEIDNETITGTANDMLIIVIHFVIMTLALKLYQNNFELEEIVEQLDKSNENLQEAYEKLEETTAIRERQKIAKDIHDTAGHSITTVIMQTEAARLIIDKDPAEAKKRIAAANLQAKNALEELRTSVHLLSGRMSGHTLKELLERIVADTSNGTDIAIRADIQDVNVDEEKAVFLCNSLKEGLSNGIRHGDATAFFFELKQDDYALSFLLSDNGKGADTSRMQEGFGLTGMRSRAETLGGIVHFASQRGEGFEIEITLPNRKKED